jgi:hypothetical protein
MFFSDAGRIGVFAGVFKKTWCSTWSFCGEFVVKCVVIAGGLTVTFRHREIFHFFELYFAEATGG